MTKYAGNKWDDKFESIEEAIAVTKYRLAEEMYVTYVQLSFSGDKEDKVFKISSELALDKIETTINGNRDVYRKYVQRMETSYISPTPIGKFKYKPAITVRKTTNKRKVK